MLKRLAALLILVAGVVSAGVMVAAGIKLMSLKSIAGGTLAEAYYQGLGLGLIGLSVLVLGVAGGGALYLLAALGPVGEAVPVTNTMGSVTKTGYVAVTRPDAHN